MSSHGRSKLDDLCLASLLFSFQRMSQPAAKTVAVAGMGIGMVASCLQLHIGWLELSSSQPSNKPCGLRKPDNQVFTFFLLCLASNCFVAVRPRAQLVQLMITYSE